MSPGRGNWWIGSGAVGVAKGSDLALGEDGVFGIESERDGGILWAAKEGL